jgi:hypothetical protein
MFIPVVNLFDSLFMPVPARAGLYYSWRSATMG